MEILKYINRLQEEQNYNNSNERCFIYMLNGISKMATGIVNNKIHFNDLVYRSYSSDDSYFNKETGDLYLGYKLFNGGNYQYNYVIVKNYEIIEYHGNASNQIKKIFELLYLIDEQLFDKYTKIIEVNYLISKTLERDEKIKSGKQFGLCYNKLNNKTIVKINKLNKIHQNLLLNFSNTEIIKCLNILLPIWEIENFNIVKQGFLGLDSYVEGAFSNMDIPSFSAEEQTEIINFPSDTGVSLCSEFLVVRNFHDIKINNRDIIKLKNIRKNSKVKEYKYIETSCDGYIAVKNIKTNIIEYLVDIRKVEDTYDALFTCNKLESKGWFNKRVDYISN